LSSISETCSCQREFTTNWWQLTPYTTFENNTAVGIFPDILTHAIEFCCEDCVYGDAATINFIGNEKTKALQRGFIEVKNSLREDIDFHFPIHGTGYKMEYAGGYPYVPLVHSPGAAFIISSHNGYNQSERVIQTFLDSWTFIVVLVLASYMVGLVMWLIVSSLIDINVGLT
jgi:hypothetical protein